MKRIIILEQSSPWPSQKSFNYLMWADVPVARQFKYVKDVNWVSAYKDATDGELADLRNGLVAESVSTYSFTSGMGMNAIKTELQNNFDNFQAEINGERTWQFYGTFFDGTTWTSGGV